MSYSLKTKVSSFVAATVITVSLISTFLFVSAQKTSIERELIARGAALSESLARAIDEGLAAEDLNLINHVQDIVHTNDVVLVQAFSTLWLGVSSDPADQLNVPPSPAAVEHFRKTRDEHGYYFINEGELFDIYAPVFLEPHDSRVPKILIGYVRLKLSTMGVRKSIKDAIITNAVFSALITLIAIIVLNAFIRRYMLTPILNLNKSVSKYKQGEFPDIVPVYSHDEIGKLSSEFNQMSRALREREERLAEEKERLFVTLRSIGDAVIVTDTTGAITLFNKVAEINTGWTVEEAAGRQFSEVFNIVNEKTRERCEDPMTKVIATGQISGLANHTVLIRKDESEIIIEDSAAPVKDRNGVIIGVILVFRDVTEHKQVENALFESERKYRDLFDSATDAIFILDLEGRIIDVNKTAYTRLGYSKQEMLSLNIISLDPPEFASKVPERLAQISRHGEAVFESAHIRKDGSIMPVEVNSRMLEYEGRLVYFSVIRDITERKRAEAENENLQSQLLQAQKMEAIGHLAGGVAHDFNNILSAIVGYAHIVQMKMSDDDPLRKHMGQILASVERAANLTRSLLAFSRKQVIQVKTVKVNDIVLGMTKIIERIIGEDIYLQVNTAVQDLTVNADKNQIEQVLMNLTTNARDAMPGGGTLRITTGEFEIDEKYVRMHQFGEVGKYAVISVTDTGAGMDETTKENIFDPFFTTKEVGKGTGLGLAMAYGTIKQHNGFINVYSEQGTGTTFRIYLPLVKARAEVHEDRGTPSIPSGTETILLVEDDEAVRNATTSLLEEFGYKVIEAADGTQAVKLFNKYKDAVQLVITDIIMPGQSGKEVYEELKKIAGVRVLFISGYSADILAKKGIIDNDVNFIPKPVNPEIFLKKVRALLDE